MKRIIGLLTLAALLVVPSLASASGQVGLYVTPKFIYGGMMMDGIKITNRERCVTNVLYQDGYF